MEASRTDTETASIIADAIRMSQRTSRREAAQFLHSCGIPFRTIGRVLAPPAHGGGVQRRADDSGAPPA